MKVSIHQPQYLPWLPYFLKIRNSEKFILLDTVSFQKNGIQNRNQIKTSQGQQWLTVPIKRESGQKIIDTAINNSTDWKQKHWNSILQNYNKSRFFKQYAEELEEIYLKNWDSLSLLNKALIDLIMSWMDINTEIIFSSEMNSKGSGSDLILNLCIESGATQYISGLGGRNYIDIDSFDSKDIGIIFESPKLPSFYEQGYQSTGFINDLSVIDLIFNSGDNWVRLI